MDKLCKLRGKRLIIVSNELPLPANTGGRLDQWNRASLLSEIGVSLNLYTWGARRILTPRSAQLLRKTFSNTVVFDGRITIGALVKRLAFLPKMSPHVSSRVVGETRYLDALVNARRYNPDAIFLDGMYGYDFAVKLSRGLHIPLVYRSHNVEHEYLRQQANATSDLMKKFFLHLARINLKTNEKFIRSVSSLVLDISPEDAAFWKKSTSLESVWVPPIYRSLANFENKPFSKREYDVGFIGNLFSPNNLKGIRWFLAHVFPALRQRIPSIRFLIAGSTPSREAINIARQNEGTILVADPPDITSFLGNCRVVINPVLSGSGVNIKALDMLMSNSNLVTTSIGVRGLGDAASEFAIADSPRDFADAVEKGVTQPFLISSGRTRARIQFTTGAAELLVFHLQSLFGDE